MIKLEETTEYKNFEISLKKLINRIDSDIINMKIDSRKTSKNISIVINKEEKLNIKL
jgi:hypothetical protein